MPPGINTAGTRAYAADGFAGTVIEGARRRPGGRCMTGIALHRRCKMPRRWLRRCTAAGAVTGFAVAGAIRLMHPGATDEGRGGMA